MLVILRVKIPRIYEEFFYTISSSLLNLELACINYFIIDEIFLFSYN